jgi:hypothetical protein
MNVKETVGVVDSIDVAHYTDKWRAFSNMVMILRVS